VIQNILCERYGFALSEIATKHQLSRCISAIEAIRLDDRQRARTAAGEGESRPAPQTATTDDQHPRVGQRCLIVTGHVLVAGKQIRLGGMNGRRKSLGLKYTDYRACVPLVTWDLIRPIERHAHTLVPALRQIR
jgi:hypothetical protein